MKIVSYEVTTLKVPEDEPLANIRAGDRDRFRDVVILRLRTDNGLQGIGVTLYGGKMTCTAVEELCELTVGADPMRTAPMPSSFTRATSRSSRLPPSNSEYWLCR